MVISGRMQMQMQTHVSLVALLCLIVCVAVCSGGQYDVKNGRHNITMGHRRLYPQFPVDMLLVHDNPRLGSEWMRVQSYDVCYPPTGITSTSRFTITMFNVTDVMPKGEGGYAFITKGGVNSGVLCLHLKTQRGYGYNFIVNIWGYYL